MHGSARRSGDFDDPVMQFIDNLPVSSSSGHSDHLQFSPEDLAQLKLPEFEFTDCSDLSHEGPRDTSDVDMDEAHASDQHALSVPSTDNRTTVARRPRSSAESTRNYREREAKRHKKVDYLYTARTNALKDALEEIKYLRQKLSDNGLTFRTWESEPQLSTIETEDEEVQELRPKGRHGQNRSPSRRSKTS